MRKAARHLDMRAEIARFERSLGVPQSNTVPAREPTQAWRTSDMIAWEISTIREIERFAEACALAAEREKLTAPLVVLAA